MEVFRKTIFILLYFFIVKDSVASQIDSFVIKEITEYDSCPAVYGPRTNITRLEDYESASICFRFTTIAYPHCSGENAFPLLAGGRTWWKQGNMIEYRIYQPISGMSEDGKHAGWLGFALGDEEGKRNQVVWRLILYKQPLEIYQWQSACISYTKETNQLLLFHNGVRYLEQKLIGGSRAIAKDFLSITEISSRFRGSFSDLQVYSKPMKEKDLEDWTKCRYDKAGDVFQWDINKFNLTIDERIVSTIEKVDKKSFCKSEEKDQREIHVFGQAGGDMIFSHIEATHLCKRLNGKMSSLPRNAEELEVLHEAGKKFNDMTNTSGSRIWIGGRTKLGDKYGASHWYPENPSGVYAVEDPETGENLLNEENLAWFKKDHHTYQKLVHLCVIFLNYNDRREDNDPLVLFWQKCTRKFVGRVFCEFTNRPTLHIKGLCKDSPIDRNFQLIDPQPGQGKGL